MVEKYWGIPPYFQQPSKLTMFLDCCKNRLLSKMTVCSTNEVGYSMSMPSSSPFALKTFGMTATVSFRQSFVTFCGRCILSAGGRNRSLPFCVAFDSLTAFSFSSPVITSITANETALLQWIMQIYNNRKLILSRGVHFGDQWIWVRKL